MNQEGTGIGFIYLDINGLLVITKATPNVLQLPFPPDIVRDMEVVSTELLEKELGTFFANSSIGPARFVIALSQNLLFEQPFTKSQDTSSQKAIEQFLESVPFEHPGTIIFENAESKIIAANKDFYQSFVEALQKLQSVVVLVTPAVVLGVDVNQALALNGAGLDDIFRRAQSLKQYGFSLDSRLQATAVTYTQAGKEKVPEKKEEKKETPRSRMYIFIGVFALLLVALALVIVFNPFS